MQGRQEDPRYHRFGDKEDREWVQADSLRPGDQLRTPDGGTATIAGPNEFTQRQTVHNLTAHDLHTYHVSAGGSENVLVHNSGCNTPRNPDDFNQGPVSQNVDDEIVNKNGLPERG